MTKKDIIKRTLIIFVNMTIFLLLLFAYIFYTYNFFVKWEANPILILSSPILFYILYRFVIFDWKLNNLLSLKGAYSYLLITVLYFCMLVASVAIYDKFIKNNYIYEIYEMIFSLLIIPLIISSFHYLRKDYDTRIILKRILLPIILFELFLFPFFLSFTGLIYSKYYYITDVLDYIFGNQVQY